MTTLDDFARAKLAALDVRLTRRRLTGTERLNGIHVMRNGRRLVSFCCNDYLNLTHHPAVRQASVEAIEAYGTGAAASRLVTGNHPLYAALEARLAAHKSTEAAAVFGSGYLANLGTIAALVGPGDLVLVDGLAHACLNSGARLSGAEIGVFRHNDLDHLATLLDQSRGAFRHRLIATETVFSMDGDRAPLRDIAGLAHDSGAWLLADDAHGLGIVPPPPADLVPLQMGTLSKILGSYGGYVCASAAVIDLLHSRARPFVYSTGLPPASIAAATTALDLIAADPKWARSPLERAQRFAALVGLPEPESQIVPIIIGDSATALEVSAALEERGFLVTAIRPPTVPEGTARLRLTFTANHSDHDIEALAEALRPRLRAA